MSTLFGYPVRESPVSELPVDIGGLQYFPLPPRIVIAEYQGKRYQPTKRYLCTRDADGVLCEYDDASETPTPVPEAAND